MALPVTTALGRQDRLWPAALASAAVHAALIVWALLRAPAAPIDLEQKPIVAKLVRLGEKRPEQYLPRKEALPPPPAPAAPAPVVTPGPAPTPAAPAVAVPHAPPKPAPPKATSPARGTGNTLASVLSKMEKQQVDDKRWGAPDGDPSGDSETAAEGDRYLAVVQRQIQTNYNVPATISERERMYLKGTIVLFIDPDGRISRWRFESRSGNGSFDDALERALRATRLPPPPDGMKDLYRRQGLQVIFQIG
jgi:colicin import membrane protein/protein TonB